MFRFVLGARGSKMATGIEHFRIGGTAQVTVGTSEVALPSTPGVRMLTVKADPDNTNPVFVGLAGVTTATGYELDPGEDTPWLPAVSSEVRLISDAAGQNVSVFWLK